MRERGKVWAPEAALLDISFKRENDANVLYRYWASVHDLLCDYHQTA